MGTQSILVTPLFSADVFQWARLRNAHRDAENSIFEPQNFLVENAPSEAPHPQITQFAIFIS